MKQLKGYSALKVLFKDQFVLKWETDERISLSSPCMGIFILGR